MRVFAFVFSFLFLIQLNAAAICSVYCESTKMPPCHQSADLETEYTNLSLDHSCCEDESACNTIDEQDDLFISEKNNSNQKLDLVFVGQNFVKSYNTTSIKPLFIVTHYYLNGPPLYLLYSQLKIPSAA